MAGVRPIARRPAEPAPGPSQGNAKPKAPPPPAAMPKASRTSLPVAKPSSPIKPLAVARAARVQPPNVANTLDGSWDRRLSRGLVSPDRTVDLHGHTLASAYDMLDAALAAAIRAGDRTILLATGDWLAGSRHSSAIAAVRAAHPRHGGAGALYIVLKRPRTL
jgi:DNA-nicking Smr family endonuclease